MIDVKKRLPQVYSQSYDMSIFTGLLNLIYNSREVDNLRAKVSHCPLHCFDEDVPRLASLFGLPTSATRDILSTYRRLVKIKGTFAAVQKAVLASSNFTLQDLSVLTDANNPSYTYTLPDLTDYDWDLFFSLIHRLAPVNTVISVEPTLGRFIIPIEDAIDDFAIPDEPESYDSSKKAEEIIDNVRRNREILAEYFELDEFEEKVNRFVYFATNGCGDYYCYRVLPNNETDTSAIYIWEHELFETREVAKDIPDLITKYYNNEV